MSDQNPQEPKQTIQRWYDQPSTVSQSVKLLETFPPDFQMILGETIIKLAEKHCKAHELMANLRSLGPEKVLNIFKSKNKKRTYDQYQSVHQAMNYMYILPDDQRLLVATHIIKVVTHFFDYFKLCKVENIAPSAVTVAALGDAYVDDKLVDVKTFLAQYQPPTSPAPIPESVANNLPPEADSNKQHDEMLAMDRNQSMKIRMDKLE